MRIVFVNLHVNNFYLRSLSRLMIGRKSIAKHRYFLNWLLENDIEVLNLITTDGTSLPTQLLRKLTRNLKIRKKEAGFVLKKNGILSKNIRNITNPAEIKNDDIVIYYGTFFDSQYENAESVHGIKIVDLLHFYGDKKKAILLKNIDFRYFIFDVDLRKYSKLFSLNYTWFKGEYVMRPFSYEPRFEVRKAFAERKNKAVAMGTLTVCEIPEFVQTYGSIFYQPRRKMILDYAEEYSAELDSYISEYYADEWKVKEDDTLLIKKCKKMYNYLNCGKQKSYFSFDMVEKYNEYKMFICPEDVNGSYGIGTIEGMACGCAMIGWDYGAFEDMGMMAGVHYIPYDGTMGNLIEKIRYYQKPDNQMELEQIAQAGCKYVRENFSQEKVAERLYHRFLQITENTKNEIGEMLTE